MLNIRLLLFLEVMLVIIVESLAKSKYYTGENRPYEFGFNIEGEQHRHEKKDENGIIMGEFGFITADGVYHVTVYATDENGNFKILSMKNIRLMPYPKSNLQTSLIKTTTTPVPTPTIRLPASVNTKLPPQIRGGPVVETKLQQYTQRACSSCSLSPQPEMSPIGGIPEPLKSTTLVRKLYPSSTHTKQPSTGTAEAPKASGRAFIQNQRQNSLGPNEGTKISSLSNAVIENSRNKPNNPSLIKPSIISKGSVLDRNRSQNTLEKMPLREPRVDNLTNKPDEISEIRNSNNQPNNPSLIKPSVTPYGSVFDKNRPQNKQESLSLRHPRIDDLVNPLDGKNSGLLNQPRLFSAKMSASENGENNSDNNGLPKGITAEDMMNLLYRFNYTVGFHGHHEDGYTNGDKIGDYFVNNRDGVQRKVDYLANEFGYQPNITRVELGLDSPKTPKENTEKNEEFGLKGYEFKWFHVPKYHNL